MADGLRNAQEFDIARVEPKIGSLQEGKFPLVRDPNGAYLFLVSEESRVACAEEDIQANEKT